MIYLKADRLSKVFQGQTLWNIPELTIHRGQRIGLTGMNGSGKTTLLNVLAGELTSEDGQVQRFCPIRYYRQLEEDIAEAEGYRLSRMQAQHLKPESPVSGGEKARLQLAAFFSQSAPLAFLDEPTANLDQQGLDELRQALKALDTFVLISHDLDLIRSFCTQIWSLENHKMIQFSGTWDAWVKERDRRRAYHQRLYQQTQKEKYRLELAAQAKERQADTIQKKPRLISAKEYRQRRFVAVRKSYDGRQKNLMRAAEAIRSRINHLPDIEKPRDLPLPQMDWSLIGDVASKYLFRAEQLTFGYQKTLLENAEFQILNHSRTGLLGPNGCGKTTLLKLLTQPAPEITVSPGVRWAILDQELKQLQDEESVLSQLLKCSVQSETIVRTVLAHLLFTFDDLNKPAGVLSGGERVRLTLAGMLCSDANVLILDEPTNYLDPPSIEALIRLLTHTQASVLVVSHDRYFLQQVCDRLLIFKQHKLLSTVPADVFARDKKNNRAERTILEMRMAQLIDQLQKQPGNTELEAQFQQLSQQLRESR